MVLKVNKLQIKNWGKDQNWCVKTTRISYRGKNLSRFLFNFGVIDKTDDDCEQQVSTVALYLQQPTTSEMRRRSARLTAVVVWRQSWSGGRINICTYFV